MDLILFFFLLAKGAAVVGTAFIVAMVIDMITAVIQGITIHPLCLISIVLDIILIFVFRHLGYPVKPMMWTFLICSIVGLNPIMAVLNIVGIILYYVFI